MWPTVAISSTVVIPTYPLMVSFACCVCILWSYLRHPAVETLDLAGVLLLSGFVGARFFHIIYEEPLYYWHHPAQMFFIWQGGFVWYGGCLAALAAGWLWCRHFQISFLAWADFFAPMAAVGYGLGRIACFLNGCCYGKVCSWGLHFKSHASLGMAIVPRHPTQLYMAVAEFITAALLLRFESRWRSQRGRLFFTWLALHGFWRLVIGFWRDDYSGPTFGIFNIASIVSALLLTVALIGLWRSPRATTSRRIDNQVL